MKTLYFPLFFLLFLFACTQEEEINESLDPQLIGTWTNGFRNYTFNEDRTFSLVFKDTSDLRLFSIELLYDSIVGDFYTIDGQNTLVLEAKEARRITQSDTMVNLEAYPEVTDYTITDNILTLISSTSQIGYIRI